MIVSKHPIIAIYRKYTTKYELYPYVLMGGVGWGLCVCVVGGGVDYIQILELDVFHKTWIERAGKIVGMHCLHLLLGFDIFP